MAFRVQFDGPLTLYLPNALDAPVPPTLAHLLGYPCVPPERYVCFYWSGTNKCREPELIWFDGLLCQYADPDVWNEYINHWYVDFVLSRYELGGPAGNRVRTSRDCLIVDTVASRLHVLPVKLGCALARRAAGNELCAFPQAQRRAYLRDAHAVVSPSERPKMEGIDELRTKRLSNLQDWLNRNGIPF